MNWGQIKDHVSHMCLAGIKIGSILVFSTRDERSEFFFIITNIFVTEFSEFNENI